MFFKLFIIASITAGLTACEKNDCEKSPTSIQIRLSDEGEEPRQEDCGVNLDPEPATDSSTTTPAPQSPPVSSTPTVIVLPDAEAPVVSPPAGVYTVPQAVSFASNTADVSIYYTTDGTNPTTASNLFVAPISFSNSLTLKAIAVKSGYNNSSVSTFEYTIGLALPDPTFSPASGAFGPPQSVAINSSYSPDFIYYTTDGTDPTTSSSIYTVPVYVSSSKTIKAFAVKAGWADSQVTSSSYVINGAVSPPSFSVAAGSYGPAQTVVLASTTTGALLYYTTDGSTPSASSTPYSGPVSVSTSQTVRAIATKQDYIDSTVSSATYTINGTVATPTFSVAAGAYGPAQTVAISTTTNGATIHYTVDGSTPTTSSAVYSSALTVSSSQTVRAIGVKQYFSNSSVASAAYTINGSAAAPTFSVAAGAYGPSQSVVLSSATAGASIRYTLDGSTPTTSSTLYTSAISVATSLTIRAIAIQTAYINSSVSSATYTINGAVATPTFSVAQGAYSTARSVTIATTTPSATIYYTTNNTTPTTSSTVYTGPVTISATTTLRAMATRANFSNSGFQAAIYTITTYGIITTVAGTGVIGSSGDGAVATLARLYGPSGVAIDGAGNIYIADTQNNKIRRVAVSTNIISTYAGNGLPTYSGDGSAAVNASIRYPYGLAFDASGNLYFSDQYNHRVRRVNVATGIITTVAGNGSANYDGDGGPASSASLNFPSGIAFNAAGELFIADQSNNRIRKISTNGIISTVAGSGELGSSGDGAAATSAKLANPTGVAVSADNKLYIADSLNNKIRVVNLSTGTISTFAGTGSANYTGNDGNATAATLNSPKDVRVDSANNVLIVDQFNHVVRMVLSSTGTITTVVGNGSNGYSGNNGYAINSTLEYPVAMTLDGSDGIYIADFYNNVIRKAPRVP